MGLLVELRLSNDEHTITDSIFWLNKALTLATDFGLKHYEKMIKEKRIKRIENNKNEVWYEIEDDNLDDNLYYNGIEISIRGLSGVHGYDMYTAAIGFWILMANVRR